MVCVCQTILLCSTPLRLPHDEICIPPPLSENTSPAHLHSNTEQRVADSFFCPFHSGASPPLQYIIDWRFLIYCSSYFLVSVILWFWFYDVLCLFVFNVFVFCKHVQPGEVHVAPLHQKSSSMFQKLNLSFPFPSTASQTLLAELSALEDEYEIEKSCRKQAEIYAAEVGWSPERIVL